MTGEENIMDTNLWTGRLMVMVTRGVTRPWIWTEKLMDTREARGQLTPTGRQNAMVVMEESIEVLDARIKENSKLFHFNSCHTVQQRQ